MSWKEKERQRRKKIFFFIFWGEREKRRSWRRFVGKHGVRKGTSFLLFFLDAGTVKPFVGPFKLRPTTWKSPCVVCKSKAKEEEKTHFQRRHLAFDISSHTEYISPGYFSFIYTVVVYCVFTVTYRKCALDDSPFQYSRWKKVLQVKHHHLWKKQVQKAIATCFLKRFFPTGELYYYIRRCKSSKRRNFFLGVIFSAQTLMMDTGHTPFTLCVCRLYYNMLLISFLVETQGRWQKSLFLEQRKKIEPKKTRSPTTCLFFSSFYGKRELVLIASKLCKRSHNSRI